MRYRVRDLIEALAQLNPELDVIVNTDGENAPRRRPGCQSCDPPVEAGRMNGKTILYEIDFVDGMVVPFAIDVLGFRVLKRTRSTAGQITAVISIDAEIRPRGALIAQEILGS